MEISKPMVNRLPVLVLMGAASLWGLAWLPLKGIHALGIDGVALTFATYLLLALALTPLLLHSRDSLKQSSGRTLFLLALFGGGANLCFAVALIYGEVIRVMMLFYLLPVWGVLGGRIFLGEHVDGARWLGVGLALAGAILILGGVDILRGPLSWVDLTALASGFLLAMNNLVFRASRKEPFVTRLAAMFYGCVFLAGAVLWLGIESWPTSVGTTTWGAIALYAFGWLLFANLGAQYGVTHMEAGRAAIIMIMELLVAVASATLIGDESMVGWEIVGAGFIILAAIIEAMREEPDKPPHIQQV